MKINFNKVKAIFWDIDGTLFSSEEIIADTYRQAFLDIQTSTTTKVKIPSISDILEQIGKPLKEIYQNLVPELNEHERTNLASQVNGDLVRRITYGEGKYYQNISASLSALHSRGYKFFCASNGCYPYVEAILRVGNVIQYFQKIETLDNKSILNKIELVAYLLKKYNLSAEESVLVGDRKSDSDAAYHNKIGFIACAYGHGRESEWKDPQLVIKSLAELENYL